MNGFGKIRQPDCANMLDFSIFCRFFLDTLIIVTVVVITNHFNSK